MREVLKLKRTEEELCNKLCMDPYCISNTTVPTTAQLDGVKDNIKRMEEEKFDREERYINLKDGIPRLASTRSSRRSPSCREIACEDTERFTLSSTNFSRAANILKMLENQVKSNQKRHMEMVENISSLYEELKKANIEQFIINLRNELNDIWDRCFYSDNQKNSFQALHSIDFTEELLEKHEAELDRMKEYQELNRELFIKVEKRQEIWSKFMELERRAKDPSRLMHARGTEHRLHGGAAGEARGGARQDEGVSRA